jgi:hypothetical protein
MNNATENALLNNHKINHQITTHKATEIYLHVIISIPLPRGGA